MGVTALMLQLLLPVLKHHHKPASTEAASPAPHPEPRNGGKIIEEEKPAQSPCPGVAAVKTSVLW